LESKPEGVYVEALCEAAFDLTNQIAFAISITTGEDILEKLGKLLIVRPEIADGLGGMWQLRLVIITTLRRNSIIGDHVATAIRQGVLVLTNEDLGQLMDESLDVRGFGEALIGLLSRERPLRNNASSKTP
jgi:hypothetical protein